MKDTVIVFARAPRLGAVKRRLARDIGARAALRFHVETLTRLLRAFAADRRFRTVLAITPDHARFHVPVRVARIPQGSGDLGARMHRAFRHFPRGRAVLVGCDIPDAGPSDAHAAFRALGSAQAAFGPAADGGYWLVAMSPRRPARPFAGARWSTEHALADTRANFTGRRVALLRTLHDVDTAEDWRRLTARKRMPDLRIGMLLFPRMTQLDLTGPFEVFSRLPGAEVKLLAKTLGPVAADTGLSILPHATLRDCPQLDIICVPGGPGVNALMEDAETLDWLRERAVAARYVTSVCTGSLVLGAAGLLRGKRATSHWSARDLLAAFGATPVAERVVRDGNLFTGGGVTAGIDFALTIAAEIAGPAVAQAIQLGIEYAPSPPFQAGTPDTAPADVVAAARARAAGMRADREAIVARVTPLPA